MDRVNCSDCGILIPQIIGPDGCEINDWGKMTLLEGKISYFCKNCSNGLKGGMTESEVIDHIARPLWQVTGNKPTAKEKAYDKQLKFQGKTYGDVYRERLEKRGRREKH